MPNKKIRRKRQKSLFSMTSADEYSMLDSGRMSGGFDPTGVSYSIRPSVGTAPLGNEPDSKDPPSLDLLAEMIKEEIRQASSLKQALERIGIETENMSHRVTNLSTNSSLNSAAATADDQALVLAGVRKQVQFTIPDDVRFRWLGIFQQPQDEQDSEGNNSDRESSRKPAPGSLPPVNGDTESDAVVPDVTAALDTPLPHTHSSAEHCTQEVPADQESPDLAASAAMQNQEQQSGSAASDPALLASGRPQRSTSLAPNNTSLPQPNRSGGNGTTEEPQDRSTPTGRKNANSLDQTESESSGPYTSNSSLEAVYGGSRSDTREASLAPKVQQRKTDNESTNTTRLGHMPLAGSDYAVNNATSGVTHKSTATATAEQAQKKKKDDERELILRPKRGEKRRGSPSFMKQQTAGGSAFAQPTLATSKVTVPKRYSVSPPFDPLKVDAVAIGKKRAATEQSGSEQQQQQQQQQQTSYARNSNQALVQNPTQKGGMGRRRNSYDAPGFQSRGPTANLTHELPAFDFESTTPHTKPPQNQTPSFGGGLFRRVTTSSAHRKGSGGLHNYQTPKSQDQISTEDHDGASIDSNASSLGSGAAGLIGGTRDFFKHRLRSRTNSNQLRNNGGSHSSKNHFIFGKLHNGDGAGSSMSFLETIASGKASDTVRGRERKRSDVEVKTRETEPVISPQQEAHQQNKHHLAKGALGKHDGDESVHQPPLTLRTLSSESHSSWLAVQPLSSTKSTSSVHNDSAFGASTPLHGSSVLTSSQRKSHDDVIPSISRSRQSTYGYRQRARASSSDGHPSQSFRSESSMRLTKGQLELLRLPPVKDGEQAAIEGILGTRSKGHRGSKPDHQQRQNAPKQLTTSIDHHWNTRKRADSAAAEVDNDSRADDRGFRPPPMPQMPPPPPSLQAPGSPPGTAVSGRSSNTISKAGDTDSIDYHMRRLKSDRKGRRSSFMTTISSILGRKD